MREGGNRRPKGAEINWEKVKKILVIRLRSIGDTVLTTPSLIALRRFLPEAQIDILLEDWVAPLLEGFDANVITAEKSKLQTALKIRNAKYDLVFNLHGGTTSTMLAFASGAKYRIGYSHYRYAGFHTHLLSSSADFWQQEKTHSAEQQLALLGFAGIPVEDRPKSKLAIHPIPDAIKSNGDFALLHPVAAFDTKEWAAGHFARIAGYLHKKGLEVIAVGAKNEREKLEKLKALAKSPITIFDDLSLPEITALAAKAKIFIGNDSGIAHIAAAVETPGIVIFGSSNRDHWYPWSDAPFEMIYDNLPCQPCAGYTCKEFGEPKCILGIAPERIEKAIDKLLKQT